MHIYSGTKHIFYTVQMHTKKRSLEPPVKLNIETLSASKQLQQLAAVDSTEIVIWSYFFFPIFSTVFTESLNLKNGIAIHCSYVSQEELIYDFANNTVHQLFVLGISGPAQ